ncbi:probable disease resistance protein At4g27220 [Populus alba]|uniref:probable disease resistance protein At4g27220 n=1 Tax=Populus alba TaxID=43335 RepID=UPI003CC78E45
MLRSYDPFWNDVEKMDDGRMECKFCGHLFAKGTSISRVKLHLSGVKRRGVKICKDVPEEVQEAARAAIDGPPEKKLKTVAGSGSNDAINAISASAQEQNNEGRHVEMAQQGEAFSPGELEEWVDSITDKEIEPMHDAFETIPRAEQVQHLERGSSLERPSINQADEPRGDSFQPTDPLCLDHGIYYDRLWSPLVNNDFIMNDVQNMVRVRTEPEEGREEEDVENNSGRSVQPGVGASSSGGLKYDETRGDLLPIGSTGLVGRAFEENMHVIRSLLIDDGVSTIGIYGMGGVGKTTMLQHIHNELLQRPDFYHYVYWVTMSRDFSINRLQNLIAKRLDLDLSSEDDDVSRAVKLSKELRKKKKWILILDDLWNFFKPHKVGIPIPLKGCKLIMTTRSERICDRMDCQHKMKVMPLSEGEAWTLFMEELRNDIAFSPKVERIAVAVIRECAGLPLGIITMAGSLRGVDDIHEWRNTLKKLKESKLRDMEDEVFRLLRFSYDRLDDLALQKCLLYCTLFPEDHKIEREELIDYLINEGIVEGIGRRQEELDEGHTMLNRLEDVCLLEWGRLCNIRRFVKMHDLIRDMAIQILQENSQVIVQAGAQLRELPDVEEWTENLTRVSLMHNHIKEIPSSHSPRCPYLSTLLLCHNERLGFIADSFFKQLLGLKVLDLSYTHIENLADSVSDLVRLTTLLLKGCEKLRHVPSLQKLRALKKLDLSNTTLEKMPQGMECLSNLRYLRINGCGEKEFPGGILSKLSHLQVFILEEWMPTGFESEYVPVTVKGKEVGCLRKLETLECHFEGHSDLVEYLKSRDENHSPSTYKIFVGLFEEFHLLDKYTYCRDKSVWLGNLTFNRDGNFQDMFLNDLQELLIYKCNDATSLCDVPFLMKTATELEVISIWDCNGIESMVSSSWFCSAPLPSSSYNGIFSSLKKFNCYRCRSMKKLFPLALLPSLVNLEQIIVYDCEKMEEIIWTRSDEEDVVGEEESSSNIEFKLPKLRVLDLCDLPKLKSICSAKLICDSLEEIEVSYCHELKRMEIFPPVLENGQPSPPPSLARICIYPKEWWESVVEWEHPNTKDVLLPFVVFL